MILLVQIGVDEFKLAVNRVKLPTDGSPHIASN